MKSYRDAGYGEREDTNARRSTTFATSINMEPRLFGRIIYHESIVYEDDNVPIMHGGRRTREHCWIEESLDKRRVWLEDEIQGHTL